MITPVHIGWFATVSVVVAYEIVAPEGMLLSEGMDRALVSHPIATRLVVAVVAMHLLNLLPERIDPLHRLAAARKPLRVRRHRVGAENG